MPTDTQPLAETEGTTDVRQRSMDPAALVAMSLFVIAIAFQVMVAWKFWALTWDDSAITLGFSRTFAATGRIEPTPGSGIVEGYSTTLWMLLMTAVAKVVGNPHALLATAKIASLALNIASLFMMRAWFGSWMPKALATLIAAICGCSYMHYETINGMETPMLLALILGMLLLRQSGSRNARWLYLAAGVGVVLTRWESVWLLIPFILVERPGRKSAVSAGVWIAAFAGISIIRRLYFGDFLPNTITAKHGAPYLTGTPHDQLAQRFLQMRFLTTYSLYFALIVIVYLLFTNRDRQGQAFTRWSSGLRFTVLFVVFSLALTFGIGYNWGPPLRSFYTAWPFLFALLLLPLAKGWGTRQLRWSMLAVFSTMSLLTIVRMVRIVHELRSPYAPIYMPDATVDKINSLTGVLQTVQQATGKHNIMFAGPDMGAIMLFSDGIRVVDLGLLCNRTLAHQRYGAMESYVLDQQKPDVIEVHDMWTQLTGLEHSQRFHDDYRPVMVQGRRLFLRNSLIALVAPSRLQELPYGPQAQAARSVDGPTLDSSDVALSKSFGTYLVLAD